MGLIKELLMASLGHNIKWIKVFYLYTVKLTAKLVEIIWLV